MKVLALLLISLMHGNEDVSAGICGQGEPFLLMETPDGTIVVELFEDAAPRTLETLDALVRRRAFGEGATTDADERLRFDYTRPRLEILTSSLVADETLLIDKEIDADALGLNEERISDEGRAMDVLQHELIPAFNKAKGGGKADPLLVEWMDSWRKSMDAGFLVGVSQKEILTAQGYRFTRELDSRPVTRGSVILKSASPTKAEARLGIVLMDAPTRTGRDMVIGRVVEGLSVVEDISIRPLDVPSGMRSLDYAPREAVSISSIRIDCRP